MMVKQVNNNNGIGFLGLLAVLFIALKLTGVIAWSWFWVLSPIWIAVLLVLLLLFVIWKVTM